MSVAQGLAHYNDQMISLTEHYDQFIMSRVMKNPNIWHDLIPRGAYQLFNGLTQKTNIYRGGLPDQGGLSTWNPIGISRKPGNGDPGFDNCAPGTPRRYQYAWETIQYSGFQDEYQSDPVCLNDMKFIDYAKDQLALIIRTGVDFGISILENWNRENYVLQAMLGGRGFVMSSGALEFEDNAVYRFEYDPFETVEDVDGNQVPFIKFDASLDVSTLNWDYLDYLRTSLADRAGEAALGNDSGMPMFGLMLDLLDFERYIKSDKELRDDWRQAQPSKLIDGYNMGMKAYRGFILMHDARQMRFRVKEVDADGKLVCTRVQPLRAGRSVTIGQVPEPNPNYYRAELGMGVIFMNDVLQNLFVPSIDNLGSDMVFGPMPGLTGLWKWINIPDPQTNMLGEHGFFYGRFQVYPKPLLFSGETTVFIYRRCAQALRTKCAVETHTDVGTGAITLAAAAAEDDFDVTLRRVTVRLTAKLKAGIGDTVTVTHEGGATPMTIASDGLAPQYTLVWAAGADNAPTVYTEFLVTNTVTA